MITLYARQEPTKDPVLLEHFPDTKRKDTVIYEDRPMTRIKAVIPWDHSERPISRKHVTLNCYRYALEWMPTLPPKK